MEDKNMVQDLRDRLIVIETLLKNMANTNDLKLEKIDMKYEEKYKVQEEKDKVQNHRLDDLENQSTWQNRAIVGGIITGAIALLFK